MEHSNITPWTIAGKWYLHLDLFKWLAEICCFNFKQEGQGEHCWTQAVDQRPPVLHVQNFEHKVFWFTLLILFKILWFTLLFLFFPPEASRSEARLSDSCHSVWHHVHAGQHPQGHGGLVGGSGDPRHQGGAHDQDGHPRHIPAEQELPAVLCHLGQTGPDHARYGRFSPVLWGRDSALMRSHSETNVHLCWVAWVATALPPILGRE